MCLKINIFHFQFHFSLWTLSATNIIERKYWVILTEKDESNWLDLSKSSQFDSQHRVNLTLNIESILLSISSQFYSQYRVNLTLNNESIWLSISCQFDSQYRVNLTLNIESIWLKYSPIIYILGFPGRILVPSVTQLFRSKWLQFFSVSRWVIMSRTWLNVHGVGHQVIYSCI